MKTWKKILVSALAIIGIAGAGTAIVNKAAFGDTISTLDQWFNNGSNAIYPRAGVTEKVLVGSKTSSGSALLQTPSLQITGVSGSTQCLQADTNGNVSGAGAACGSGGGGSGTVTAFSFTNSGGFTGTVTNSTTTPALSLVLQNATTSQSGQLTSTDWNTFNNKQGAITLTTTGTSGAATFSGGTLNIPQYAGTNYWTLSGSNLYNNSGTNIGINTTSPATALDVVGQITLDMSSGTGTASLITNAKNVPNYAQTSFYPASGTNVNTTLSVIPKGTGQPGNVAQITVFNTDFLADPSNYEAMGFRSIGTAYNITETAQGTGQIRPLIISASNNNTNNQLYLDPSNKIGLFTATPDSFLNLVATLPTSVSGGINYGAHISITPQATSSAPPLGLGIDLNAGYTGGAGSYGFGATNASVSTANNPWVITSSNKGDLGGYGFYTGSGVSNVGVGGYFGAYHGGNSAGSLIGVMGQANYTANTSAGYQLGVAGLALGSSVQVGGYFGLVASAPTLTSAALIADNGTVSAPIFLGRANGVTKFTLDATGNITSTTLAGGSTQCLQANTSGTISGTGSVCGAATGAALTKTDDTNVTLTLGGTPSTALLQASSLTLGWTGTLAVGRGGTGAGTLTVHGVVIGNGTSAVNVTSAGTAGQVLTSNGSSADPTYQPVTVTPRSIQILQGNMGTSGRITQTAVVGTTQISFGANGMNIGTGSGAAAASLYTWQLYDSNSAANNVPIFAGSPNLGASFTNGSSTGRGFTTTNPGTLYLGAGQLTISGGNLLVFTAAHIGIKVIANGTNATVYATQADGTTENVSSAICTISLFDVVDFAVSVNGTTSATYTVYKNRVAQTPVTLTTNLPTSSVLPYFGLSFDNANGTGVPNIILQSAFYQ